jgi:hypothetical protein
MAVLVEPFLMPVSMILLSSDVRCVTSLLESMKNLPFVKALSGIQIISICKTYFHACKTGFSCRTYFQMLPSVLEATFSLQHSRKSQEKNWIKGKNNGILMII